MMEDDDRLRFIGRECTTNEHFTRMLARALELPELSREPGEKDDRWLIRRLEQLKWISRQWSLTDLKSLPPEQFKVAASQICHAAANFCQDLVAWRTEKARLQRPRAERNREAILDMHRHGAKVRQIAFELELEEGLVQEILDDQVPS